ncbi:MAG: OmpA family protein [Flavobacteriales bacterium]
MNTLPYIRELIFKRYEMHNYLQACWTHIATVCLLMTFTIGAGLAQSELTAEADQLFEKGNYVKAEFEFEDVFEKVKNDVELKGYSAFMCAECNYKLRNFEKAEIYYKKADAAQYDRIDPTYHLRLGELMSMQEDFDEAIKYFIEYKENGGVASLADNLIQTADNNAVEMMEPSSRYIVDNLIRLNSEAYDYGAGYASKKSDEVIFSSSREVANGDIDVLTGERYMDLFRSSQDKKDNWSTPEPLNSTINTEFNEGTVTFDKKYKSMYFTRCISDEKSSFACDIYRAESMGSRFGPAELVDLINRSEDDSSQVGHACFTVDNEYLMFVSDMPGGFGGKDIWYVSYDDKKDEFGSPVNMGPNINSAGDEMFPAMRYDGALFYSSTELGNAGGLDIMRAMPAEGEMKFEKAEAMPYPLNSSSDDFGLIFEDGENSGIFTSGRPGGKGKDDLYSFRMPPMEFCFQGLVFDAATRNELPANVTVKGSNGDSYSVKADANGFFSLCDGQIKQMPNYEVTVEYEGYITVGDAFTMQYATNSTTFTREYPMIEVVLDKEYDMPTVFYPFNEAELLVNGEVNSADSLNYLLELMNKNETFVIQLESHTDSRGNSGYNKDLSQRRAQTCVDYLIGKGIERDRLVAVGYGKERLLISDDEIDRMATEQEKEEAHQANRRTSFRIIRYDYESQN